MDYSKLSDFEINCDVLSVFNQDIKHMCLSGDNSCFYECGPTGDGWNQIDIPDYCNNPADAWPIIFGSKLWLRELFGKWQVYGFPTSNPNNVIKYFHENPLRAAMVVFLMMRDLSHE